jgi:EAL domain-containing protein (putative c-di-GMP-specific phosphodiesterase class I)
MTHPVLVSYLERAALAGADAPIRADGEGRVVGRFVNATLTSAFQPVREVGSGRIAAFEGFVRSHARGAAASAADYDAGLSPWKVLDRAADDTESIVLDRLCRVLHATNFFRQPQSAGHDLYLSVDARLLSGVGSNHGMAFLNILRQLELPQGQIVLQLPLVSNDQGWLLNYVSDNYRRNGFRLAARAADLRHALRLLDHVRPDVIKLDGRLALSTGEALSLLTEAAQRAVKPVFTRVDSVEVANALGELVQRAGLAVFAQGFLWDRPHASLAVASARHAAYAAAQELLERA